MNILAIIPARGGSKGIPRKNVIDVAGKPMIGYAIEAAKKSKYINKVVVSTDDKEIATVSKKFGAEVIDRPNEMAQDTSPVIPALQHALAKVKEKGFTPDVMVLLQPTSPLRKTEDVDNALEIYLKNKPCSVVSVCEVPHGLNIMYAVDNNKIRSVIEKKEEKLRQNVSKVYRLNGAVYVFEPALLAKGKVFEEGTLAYIMPKERSIDVDDPADLTMAEALLKKHR
jgi:CMP-N,N'-diacetyllegionaminic acid synthase